MGWFATKRKPNRVCKPQMEPLEDRLVPALIASQFNPVPPTLDMGEVKILLDRAQVATASNDAIIAVVDRMGNIIGARAEGGVAPNVLADPNLLAFAVDGAVAKARTAAFFANDQAPLTSRTVGFISQSTISEREVESYPDIVLAPDPTLFGPGFVAAVKTGAHFPPDVDNTPPVDLFGIEHTNRDSILHPGPDHRKGTGDDIPLAYRFNINPAFVPAGQEITPPLAYGETVLSPADRLNPALNHFQSRGVGTTPGGIPIYKDGVQVGGIGVFFPGTTGFATEENYSDSNDSNPALPDRTLEAEFMGLAAVGGSSGAKFPVGDLPGAPALPGFDIPFGRIDLVGITLDIIGPGGDQGPANLVFYAQKFLGIAQGTLAGGIELPVNSGGQMYVNGRRMPEGWLVTPHAGVNITGAEVERIIQQGINEANLVRAQIRTPNDERSRMVLSVADSTGQVLGLFRMPDATVFSVDVAVAKARNTAYYNDPTQLQPQDQVPGLPPGASLSNRTFRFLAEPRFPDGVDGLVGPFSILNDPGVDSATALQVGPRQPANAYQSVYGFDSFNPGSNFRAPTLPQNQNGIVFFPGSSGVYKSLGGPQQIVGGFGVSGDGVDQDDVVTFFGIKGFQAPSELRADQFFVREVRLPFMKFPRNPEN